MTDAVERIKLCLNDVDKWLSNNKLKLSKEKTELLFIHSKFRPQQYSLSICFGQDTIRPIKPSQTARNIGHVLLSTLPCSCFFISAQFVSLHCNI